MLYTRRPHRPWKDRGSGGQRQSVINLQLVGMPDVARRLRCEPNQFQTKGSTKQFGWLQASATNVSSLSITSANPATIRTCMRQKMEIRESCVQALFRGRSQNCRQARTPLPTTGLLARNSSRLARESGLVRQYSRLRSASQGLAASLRHPASGF